MSSTSRNRNLLSLIGVLLLTNIVVLGYFLWFKKPVKKPQPEKERIGITEMLQKEVGFTDDQLTEYKHLKDKQRENMRPMFDDMRKAKDSLFRLLSDTAVNDSVINKAADGIARRQKMLDLQAFYHFKNVRAICTPEQRDEYDSMVLRMFRRMGKPAKPAEKK